MQRIAPTFTRILLAAELEKWPQFLRQAGIKAG